MTSPPPLPLSAPGPVVNPAKNPHRAGVSNHHHTSGSGEIPMVGTTPAVDRATAPAEIADAVRVRISGQSHRFLWLDNHCRLTVRLDRLAVLVAEIVTERTEALRAELDAANDAVVELIAQHEAAVRALDALGSGVA